MPEKKPDWRDVLRTVVDEGRSRQGSHPDLEELAAYHSGTLSEPDEERIREHLVLCPECAGLLLDLDDFAADAARVEDEPEDARVVPIRARSRRWPWWAATAAAAAAALVLVVRSWGPPLPDYGAPRWSGDLRPTRASGAEPEVPVFATGRRFALELPPETAVEGPVTARAYLRRNDGLRALSTSTLEVTPEGVISLEGVVGTEVLLPEGESELTLAVARPGALPSRRRLLDELERRDASRGRGWIGFTRKVRVRDLPVPRPAAPEAPEPWIEYAGCRTVLAGSICVLDDDRRLTLWVRDEPEDRVRIDGRQVPAAARTEDGSRYEVEAEPGAPELVVEVDTETRRKIWVLELREPGDADELSRARELYESGARDEARRLLEARAAASDPARAGPALSLLARMEHGSGRADLGNRSYVRALAAHDRAGRLSDRIRDASALAFHRIQEGRYAEARELLDGLPVAATGGFARGRYSLAYMRGLLAEETGDFRSATAWMARAVREAERAGMERERIFAEDLLARQLHAVGLVEEAAGVYARMGPRSAELCGDGAGPAVLSACDCARLANNRAWTGLLGLEAGRPAPEPSPAALLEDAERRFREGEDCLFPDDLPNLRLNRALAALHDGDPATARRNLALARADPETFPRLALWQLDVDARIRLAQGQPESALARYRELARWAEVGESLDAAWRAAYGSALALNALGRTGEAVEACTDAEDLLDRESLQVPMHAGRTRFIAQRQRAATFCLDVLLESGRKIRALAFARRSAARALRNLHLGARIARLDGDARKRWDEAFSAHRRAAGEMDGLTAKLRRGVPLDEEARLSREIAARRRVLRRELDRAFAVLGEPDDLIARDPAPLDRGTLLLVYHPLPRGWAAFAAGSAGVAVHRLEAVEDAPDLAARLLEPFTGEIRGAEEIHVVAYGPLREVDFHALPFDDGILLDQAPVAYRLDLPAPRATAAAFEPRALLLSGPGLAAAPAETHAVRSALQTRAAGWQVDLLDESEGPSRHELLSRLPEASLFHYAGHAELDETGRGWDSHLALGFGERLTVDDVLASPGSPRWVVLSGCETARDAEDTPVPNLGLAQAFLVAGSRAAVAADGVVRDDHAADLMAAFYRRWDPSEPPAEALRQAQLELRDRAPESDWRRFRVLVR